MPIDWFTVSAQLVNFLILVWLLKRFLYKPILHAIDERELRIATELHDADAKMAEARQERDEFRRKNQEFGQQRADLMAKVAQEADAERRRLNEVARQAADAWGAKRQAALEMEAHNLNQAISLRAGQEVFAIARKVLADLAATDLEERMVGVFARRLLDMDAQEKTAFAAALKTATGPASVRSAFDLHEEQRAAIQQTLNGIFAGETPIRFETAPELVSGIELTVNGQKLAWSIADYLVSLEKCVDGLLKGQPRPNAQTGLKKPAVPDGGA